MYSHEASQVTVSARHMSEHTRVHMRIPVGTPAQKHHPPDLKLYMRRKKRERERERERECVIKQEKDIKVRREERRGRAASSLPFW